MNTVRTVAASPVCSSDAGAVAPANRPDRCPTLANTANSTRSRAIANVYWPIVLWNDNIAMNTLVTSSSDANNPSPSL